MTGVVLAGGRSTRMGLNKALVQIGDRTLIERVVSRVSQVVDGVVVVVAEEDWVTPELGPGRVRVVSDVYPGKGALGGLHSGLRAVGRSYGLVVGCDMPFLQVPLLRYLCGAAEGFDVVIPRWDDHLEPLHAVYSWRCLEPVERMLQQGRRKIIDFLGGVRVRYIGEPEIVQFDPRLVSFFNINRPDDLARAQRMAAELGE